MVNVGKKQRPCVVRGASLLVIRVSGKKRVRAPLLVHALLLEGGGAVTLQAGCFKLLDGDAGKGEAGAGEFPGVGDLVGGEDFGVEQGRVGFVGRREDMLIELG